MISISVYPILNGNLLKVKMYIVIPSDQISAFFIEYYIVSNEQLSGGKNI